MAIAATQAANAIHGLIGASSDVLHHTTIAGVLVKSNFARGSSGYGINAPGAVDGGGNKASDNNGYFGTESLEDQCIGVVCSAP